MGGERFGDRLVIQAGVGQQHQRGLRQQRMATGKVQRTRQRGIRQRPGTAAQIVQVQLRPALGGRDVEQRQVAALVFEVGQRRAAADQQVQLAAVHFAEAAQDPGQHVTRFRRALFEAADQAEQRPGLLQQTCQRHFEPRVRRHPFKPALRRQQREVVLIARAGTERRLQVQHAAAAITRIGLSEDRGALRRLAPMRLGQQQTDRVRARRLQAVEQTGDRGRYQRRRRCLPGNRVTRWRLDRERRFEPGRLQQRVALDLGQPQVIGAGQDAVAMAAAGARGAGAPVVDRLAADADLRGHSPSAGPDPPHVPGQQVREVQRRHGKRPEREGAAHPTVTAWTVNHVRIGHGGLPAQPAGTAGVCRTNSLRVSNRCTTKARMASMPSATSTRPSTAPRLFWPSNRSSRSNRAGSARE